MHAPTPGRAGQGAVAPVYPPDLDEAHWTAITSRYGLAAELMYAVAAVEAGAPTVQRMGYPWPWVLQTPLGVWVGASRQALALELASALSRYATADLRVGLMRLAPCDHATRGIAPEALVDPGVNLEAACAALRHAIDASGGSLQAGLERYFGCDSAAAGRYAERVLVTWRLLAGCRAQAA